jgi:hypothetical protein
MIDSEDYPLMTVGDVARARSTRRANSYSRMPLNLAPFACVCGITTANIPQSLNVADRYDFHGTTRPIGGSTSLPTGPKSNIVQLGLMGVSKHGLRVADSRFLGRAQSEWRRVIA